MDSSITVALITSGAGIIIALIGAYVSSNRAVEQATAPLKAEIARLRGIIQVLEGNSDVLA